MGEKRRATDRKNWNRPKKEKQPYVPSTMAALPPFAQVQHYVGCNCNLCRVN